MERDNFICYRSWVEAIEQDLDNRDDQKEVALALLLYGIHGKETKLTGAANAILRLAKVTMDTNNRKYEDGCKGGRRKTTGFSDNKPMVIEEKNHRLSKEDTYGVSKKQTTETDTDTDTDTVIVNKPKAVFKPPTVAEVKAYCEERNNGIDAQRFVDYYTSNGWRVGKSPMKDWKAAVRTWEQSTKTPNADTRQGKYSQDIFDRIINERGVST